MLQNVDLHGISVKFDEPIILYITMNDQFSGGKSGLTRYGTQISTGRTRSSQLTPLLLSQVKHVCTDQWQ